MGVVRQLGYNNNSFINNYCIIHYFLGRQVSRVILGKQLLIQGFTVFRWTDQWPRAFKEIAQWIQEVRNGRSCLSKCFNPSFYPFFLPPTPLSASLSLPPSLPLSLTLFSLPSLSLASALLFPLFSLMQGKLKYQEHVTDGFDNMFDAFLGLFKGENTGKAVVKV